MASRSSAATVERRKKPFRRAHSQRSRPGASSKRISDGTEYMDIELQAIYAAEVENGLGVYNRGYSVNEDDDERGPIDISEFIDDVSGLRDDQGFQTQIARKMRVYLIGKQEAEIEVLLDRLVEAQGGLDKALLSVVSTVYTEIKVETFVRILLFRGANPTSTDDQKQTPLHYAVRRGLIGVCTRLLEYDAHPLAKDQDSASPFKIALTKKSDEIAASLLQYIPAATVRQIYASTETQTAEFSFHHLIHTGMQKTALGVLDCMLELCSRCTENYRVYYQVLEGDEKGRGPDHPDFNRSSKSALQLIAQFGNNEIGYHNVVRLLVRRKWRKFAKWRFQFNAIVFLISLFALTYTAVVSTMTNDPTVYDTPLQISRAAFEAIGFCQVAYSLLLELVQMCRHRIEYFKDRFNWHDLISIGLLLSVIPLRYTPYKYAQWPVFSAGYLAWTFRIFKYAPVFRQTGAYAQTLWRVFAQDFPQFTILFAVILLAFSGSFLLALRGEDMLGKHEETRNFWHILFTGVRTLVEGEPIVTYTGAQTQYGAMGSVLMVLFLITCSIILLNILIAQLSDTYQTVQNDALRSLELNRAWIVARVEINSVCTGKGYRTRYYKDIEEIPNLQRALDWDKEPVTPYSKVIDQMAAQMTIQEQNMVTIKNRMARQEKLLVKIHNVLQDFIDMKKGKPVISDNHHEMTMEYRPLISRQTSWQTNGFGSGIGSRQDSFNSLNGLLDNDGNVGSSNSSNSSSHESALDHNGSAPSTSAPRYPVSPGILRKNGNGRAHSKNGNGRTNGHHHGNGFGNMANITPVVEVVEEETTASGSESQPATPQTAPRNHQEECEQLVPGDAQVMVTVEEEEDVAKEEQVIEPEQATEEVASDNAVDGGDCESGEGKFGDNEGNANEDNNDDDVHSSSADSADVHVYIGDEQPLIQDDSPEEYPEEEASQPASNIQENEPELIS